MNKFMLTVVYAFYLLKNTTNAFSFEPTDKDVAEDALLTVPELISKYNYPCEVHTVVTPDGYILELHRIPYGIYNSSGPQTGKPPILLMHGMLGSSAQWILIGPKKGFAYMLANLGYDVWMGNARGCKYSRNHTTLSPNNGKFWDFSWHEIGVIDIPVTIDYILNYTKKEKLFYVGHSQGTTSFFVMASDRPEYNDKIEIAALHSPSTYMTHIVSKLLNFIAAVPAGADAVLKLIGQFEFAPSNLVMSEYGNMVCSEEAKTLDLCGNVCLELFGYDQEHIDLNTLFVYLGHFPAGCSSKQLLHYAQSINSKRFAHYDYGAMENKKRYGTTDSPSYNFSKITAPLAFFYGLNEPLVSEEDVSRAYNEVKNPVLKYLVPDLLFNHLDYAIGKRVVPLVYEPTVIIMQKYWPKGWSDPNWMKNYLTFKANYLGMTTN